MGDVSSLDKFRRLHAMRDLIEEGKTDMEIVRELGMSLRSVQRNKRYLKDLAVADLTNKEISEKRQELYIELIEATEEIRNLFDFYKEVKTCPICKGVGVITVGEDKDKTTRGCNLCFGKGVIHFPKDAQRFFNSWLEAVEMRAKLYGLDNMKVDNITQLNQFNQYNIPDTIDVSSGKALAEMMKKQHEDKLKKIN